MYVTIRFTGIGRAQREPARAASCPVLTPQRLEHFRSLLLRERTTIEERIREREAMILATVREPEELARPRWLGRNRPRRIDVPA